jgi:uncharacterized protein (DUF2147 family)
MFKTEGKTHYQDRGFERAEDSKGKEKTDISDPDPTKRGHPIIGLVFKCRFAKKSNPRWEDGTVYDPKSGKTYSCNNGPPSDQTRSRSVDSLVSN